MDAQRILNVADARRGARRALPTVVFDYIDGAADDEVTMAANAQALRGLAFRPRMAGEPVDVRLGTAVLGTPVSLPVILAPCGLVRLMHPDGAAGAARAASSRGTIFVLSTVAGAGPEAVAAEAPGTKWFQLYAPGGRRQAGALVDRARDAGYSALVVTVDTPALGNRERDLRNGVRNPLRIDARMVARLGPQIAARPGWATRMALHAWRTGALGGVSRTGGTDRSHRVAGRPEPEPEPVVGANGGVGRTAGADSSGRGGLAAPTPSAVRAGSAGGGDAAGVADQAMGAVRTGSAGGAVADAGTVAMLASPFTWADVSWLCERWGGPVVVKGVLSGADAARAADAGADAVVVSNHGGRQLDGAPATIDVLPEVVDAVGTRVEVLVDGGIHRGGDVVKALALGAKAVLVGRAYLYGLAAAGEPGVARVLDVLRDEMTRTLKLLGCFDVADLDPSWLQPPSR